MSTKGVDAEIGALYDICRSISSKIGIGEREGEDVTDPCIDRIVARNRSRTAGRVRIGKRACARDGAENRSVKGAGCHSGDRHPELIAVGQSVWRRGRRRSCGPRAGYGGQSGVLDSRTSYVHDQILHRSRKDFRCAAPAYIECRAGRRARSVHIDCDGFAIYIGAASGSGGVRAGIGISRSGGRATIICGIKSQSAPYHGGARSLAREVRNQSLRRHRVHEADIARVDRFDCRNAGTAKLQPGVKVSQICSVAEDEIAEIVGDIYSGERWIPSESELCDAGDSLRVYSDRPGGVDADQSSERRRAVECEGLIVDLGRRPRSIGIRASRKARQIIKFNIRAGSEVAPETSRRSKLNKTAAARGHAGDQRANSQLNAWVSCRSDGDIVLNDARSAAQTRKSATIVNDDGLSGYRESRYASPSDRIVPKIRWIDSARSGVPTIGVRDNPGRILIRI